MNEEFNEEKKIELLIEDVEKHPILYNYEHKSFMEVNKKDIIWSELSLNYNVNAKRRFRSLRDRYVREKKKIDQQLLVTETVNYPNWRYFPFLTFLDKYLRKNNNKKQTVRKKPNSINNDLIEFLKVEENEQKEQPNAINDNVIEEENEYYASNNSDIVEDMNSNDILVNNDVEIKPNLVEEINMENKCGQIYLEKGKFIFLCDFCEQIFNNINIYMEHILNYHKSEESNINYLIDENLKQESDKLYKYKSFDEYNETEEDTLRDDDTISYFDINSKIDDPLGAQTLKYEIEYLDENNSNNNINTILLDSEYDSHDNSKLKSIKKCRINYDKPPKLLNESNEYPCTLCEKTYTIYKSLRDHYRINHTTKCEYCFKRFGNLHTLEIHLYEQHSDMIKQNKSINLYKKSIDLNEKLIDEFNEKSFKFNNINNDENVYDNLVKPQKKKQPEDEPIKMKNNEGRFICTICDDVTYARFENIKRHYRVVHLEVAKSRYYCDQCDKNYYSRFQLRAHMNIHKGLRPYKCHLCSADFTHPQYLNFHIRIHLNDKRYPCTYCGKKFIRPYERIYHERSNHTNEKLYQCDDCGQTFIKNSQLKSHKNIKHNPNYVRPLYECDICKNKFTTKESMQKHRLIHEGKKPFDCDICGSKFRTRHDVNVHKKIHSDIKNYVCKICDKRFAQGPGLYSHMKSHGIALSSKKDSDVLL